MARLSRKMLVTERMERFSVSVMMTSRLPTTASTKMMLYGKMRVRKMSQLKTKEKERLLLLLLADELALMFSSLSSAV